MDSLDPEEPEWQERAHFDNHYSPTSPEDYIQLRLLTMMRFYRKRLPRYATFKDFSQWLIMIGTSVGALLAYLGFAPHVSITSAGTASIAAWMEFSATAQKVSRYNGIVVALSNILLWWDSMSSVDKASPVNIDLLVQMGEATLNAERGAWLSAGAPKGEKKGNGDQKRDEQDKSEKAPS